MSGPLQPKLALRLSSLEARQDELAQQLADPEATGDVRRFRELSQAYAELEPVTLAWREYRALAEELDGARELLDEAGDAEMRSMAADEVRSLESRLDALVERLTVLLLPSDPNDSRNVVLEIRAGAGGDEATLFASELFRMYTRYAESNGWRVKTTSVSESPVGGMKEVIALIEGDRVYSRLKFESGVHRVQRVPETEAQGRIHTSAATVAVLPEADDVEIEIAENELRVDTFCSSGPGGQSVNTTQSAVRLVHLPTNLVVQCQDEKSWHKNKARAMQVLRSRLFDLKLREQRDAIAAERRGMVGGGDRSEKIRTYNFPQSRVTEHRLNLTLHSLPAVMDGDVGPLVDALVAHDQAERLRQEVDGWAETLGAVVAGATQALAAAGLVRPRDEALFLLAHLLGTDRGGVLVRRDDPLPDDLRRQFERWIVRRAAREPAQHLTGAQGFHGIELNVDSRVLIPRPETELLVDTLLEAGLGDTAQLIDLGTGSGCVAIALAVRRAGWHVTALDRSPEALAVARVNVRRHGLDERVDLQTGDMLAPPASWSAGFDAVVSNPPYVSESEWCRLEPEVRDHDPREALVAGPRGDEILLQLAPVAARLVKPGGIVAFEVGAGQAAVVEAAMLAAGLERTRRLPDLAGIERVVVATRPLEVGA